ncbi:MAG: hypothetical protein R2788_10655 [Saprospiraceae bacterium]
MCIHGWITASFLDAMKGGSGSFGMAGSETAMMMQSMTGMMDVFYSDAFLSMGLNFQDGKMVISTDMFFNQDMMRFYKGALDAKFNKKFLRYVDGGDQLFGYYYFNLNVKKVLTKEGINAQGTAFDPTVWPNGDDAMKILVFLLTKMPVNLMKGDLLLSVSGMKMMEFTQTTYDFDDDVIMIPKDTTVVKNTSPCSLLMAVKRTS